MAFEPSFCPVATEHSAPGMDELHPNMARVASFDRSRWVIDGGVLVNTPLRPALDVVATLPADAEVRRVFAYVVRTVLLVRHFGPTPDAAEGDLEVERGRPGARIRARSRPCRCLADPRRGRLGFR